MNTRYHVEFKGDYREESLVCVQTDLKDIRTEELKTQQSLSVCYSLASRDGLRTHNKPHQGKHRFLWGAYQ